MSFQYGFSRTVAKATRAPQLRLFRNELAGTTTARLTTRSSPIFAMHEKLHTSSSRRVARRIRELGVVHPRGVEPPRPCGHKDLNLACMPVSPRVQIWKSENLTRRLGPVNEFVTLLMYPRLRQKWARAARSPLQKCTKESKGWSYATLAFQYSISVCVSLLSG